MVIPAWGYWCQLRCGSGMTRQSVHVIRKCRGQAPRADDVKLRRQAPSVDREVPALSLAL